MEHASSLVQFIIHRNWICFFFLQVTVVLTHFQWNSKDVFFSPILYEDICIWFCNISTVSDELEKFVYTYITIFGKNTKKVRKKRKKRKKNTVLEWKPWLRVERNKRQIRSWKSARKSTTFPLTDKRLIFPSIFLMFMWVATPFAADLCLLYFCGLNM